MKTLDQTSKKVSKHTFKNKEHKSFDYEKAMKDMGIDKTSFEQYKGAEDFARRFMQTGILRSTSVAFTAGL